jgi:hypothetical protein
MSSSAYGRVIYGYGPQANEYLRVADGTASVCASNPSHVVVSGAPYCPRCGSRVETRDRMVPSPMVVAYAERHGVTPEGALSVLDQYQHLVRGWDSESWVFGILIADGSGGDCTTFLPIDSDEDLDQSLPVVIQGKSVLRDYFGTDLQEARYHLLVKLH